MALSQLFCKIAPYYNIIIWRNQIFLLTMRQNINDTIWKNRLLVVRKVTKQIIADDLFKKG